MQRILCQPHSLCPTLLCGIAANCANLFLLLLVINKCRILSICHNLITTIGWQLGPFQKDKVSLQASQSSRLLTKTNNQSQQNWVPLPSTSSTLTPRKPSRKFSAYRFKVLIHLFLSWNKKNLRRIELLAVGTVCLQYFSLATALPRLMMLSRLAHYGLFALIFGMRCGVHSTFLLSLP